MERLPIRLKATRGSLFSLDFNISNSKGDPFMIYKEDVNPFLIFTVRSARYKQEGDYEVNYWVDLSKTYNGDGTVTDSKKFASTEAFYTDDFAYTGTIDTLYPDVFSDNPADDNYYGNYLFYTTTSGKKEYKYYDGVGWVDYNMRIIQSFMTEDWVEQTYKLQIKYVTGLKREEMMQGETPLITITQEIVLLNEAFIDVASNLEGGK